MSVPGRPARVRVSGGPADRAAGQPPVARDAATVYLRGLMRAQLRLAVGALVGFLVAVGSLVAVVAVLPVVGDPRLAGVPLSWLLHAYGCYPITAVVAALAVRGASRNERRYQSLVDDPGEL